MKKFLLPLFLFTTAGSLSFAAQVEVIDASAVQTIRSTFSPNVKIDYKKYNINHALDLVNKTGHIDVIIYPEHAVISPAMFKSIVKGKDIFDVENYKQVIFKSTKVNFTADNKVSSTTGTLTVKNKSTPITFEVNSFKCTGELGSRTCVGDFTAQLDRTKLDLNYGTNIGLSKQAPINLKFTLKEKG